MIPARMMRIQFHCPPRHRCATIKVACMNQDETGNCKHVTVPWIQGDGPLHGCRKRSHIPAEKLRPGERFIRELAGSIQFHRPLSSRQASIQRIRKLVKPESKFMVINKRQTSPDVCISRDSFDRTFESCSDFRVFFRRKLRPVSEESKYKIIA